MSALSTIATMRKNKDLWCPENDRHVSHSDPQHSNLSVTGADCLFAFVVTALVLPLATLEIGIRMSIGGISSTLTFLEKTTPKKTPATQIFGLALLPVGAAGLVVWGAAVVGLFASKGWLGCTQPLVMKTLIGGLTALSGPIGLAIYGTILIACTCKIIYDYKQSNSTS